jgi:hypothetical protein
MILAAKTPFGVVPSRRTASKSNDASGTPGSSGGSSASTCGSSTPAKYCRGWSASPVSLKCWKYSLGMPATPVAFSSSHRSVLPLRCVAHTINPDILDRIT